MCFRALFRSVPVYCVAATLLLASPVSASSVDEVVDLIATRLVKYLDDQGKKELFIGPFTNPKSSGGRLLESKIRERLQKEGVKLLDNSVAASWILSGKLAVDSEGKSPIVAVKLELLDSGGNTKADFNERFRDEEAVEKLTESLPDGAAKPDKDTVAVIDKPTEVAQVAGTTVDVKSAVEQAAGKPVSGNAPAVTAQALVTSLPEQQAEQKKGEAIRAIPTSVLKQSITNPSFSSVGNSQVRASSSSRFGVEVQASRAPDGPFVPVAVQNVNGTPFVDLKQGDHFQILVFNDERFDVGLELRMDGINTMSFAEGMSAADRESGKWLIKAGVQGAVIKGWFKRPTPDGVDRFLITAEPEGVAAQLGRPHSIGTIQASFFMARSKGQPPSLFAHLTDPTRNAVGRGAPTEFRGTMEERTFESGQSLATISILHTNPSPPDDLPPGSATAAP